MTTIHRLEDPAHLDAGGALITYPSGYKQQLSWRGVPGKSVDPHEMGKDLAAQALQGLLDGKRPGYELDVRDTNWVSLTAGMTKIVGDWGAARSL